MLWKSQGQGIVFSLQSILLIITPMNRRDLRKSFETGSFPRITGQKLPCPLLYTFKKNLQCKHSLLSIISEVIFTANQGFVYVGNNPLIRILVVFIELELI